MIFSHYESKSVDLTDIKSVDLIDINSWSKTDLIKPRKSL
jgi:hypothetical protein